MGEKEKWTKKVRGPGGEYVIDLVKTFFADLDRGEGEQGYDFTNFIYSMYLPMAGKGAWRRKSAHLLSENVGRSGGMAVGAG